MASTTGAAAPAPLSGDITDVISWPGPLAACTDMSDSNMYLMFLNSRHITSALGVPPAAAAAAAVAAAVVASAGGLPLSSDISEVTALVIPNTVRLLS